MNFKTIRRAGISKPPDGFTVEEEQIAKILATHAIQDLYAKLPTPRMKFIVAAHFELGYSQQLVAEMLGVAQPSLIDEINLIRRVLLGRPYKPKKHRVKIKKEELLTMILCLAR